MVEEVCDGVCWEFIDVYWKIWEGEEVCEVVWKENIDLKR